MTASKAKPVTERPPAETPRIGTKRPVAERVQEALSSLEEMSTQHDRENLERFGITASKAFGVSMANIQKLAKTMGRSHELAAALWETGWYEARMLCSFVEEPEKVTAEQMDSWCREFDNWGICDTVCFKLFDQTPYAWTKVAQWSDEHDVYVKRAAFALLWSLTVHDNRDDDEPFIQGLQLIERAAADDRHFVKKAVNMALRAIGKRNTALNAAAIVVAQRLSASTNGAAKWVGKDALRELTSLAVRHRLDG